MNDSDIWRLEDRVARLEALLCQIAEIIDRGLDPLVGIRLAILQELGGK